MPTESDVLTVYWISQVLKLRNGSKRIQTRIMSIESDVLTNTPQFSVRACITLTVRPQFSVQACLTLTVRPQFRFNKIEQDCHPKQQVPDGKWTRKPLAYRESNNFVIYV